MRNTHFGRQSLKSQKKKARSAASPNVWVTSAHTPMPQ